MKSCALYVQLLSIYKPTLITYKAILINNIETNKNFDLSLN